MRKSEPVLQKSQNSCSTGYVFVYQICRNLGRISKGRLKQFLLAHSSDELFQVEWFKVRYILKLL